MWCAGPSAVTVEMVGSGGGEVGGVKGRWTDRVIALASTIMEWRPRWFALWSALLWGAMCVPEAERCVSGMRRRASSACSRRYGSTFDSGVFARRSRLFVDLSGLSTEVDETSSVRDRLARHPSSSCRSIGGVSWNASLSCLIANAGGVALMRRLDSSMNVVECRRFASGAVGVASGVSRYEGGSMGSAGYCVRAGVEDDGSWKRTEPF